MINETRDMFHQNQKGVKVLVVEDEQDTRSVMVRRIRKYGYDVNDAEDGLSALEKIELWHPDVIVLDIIMPKLDGFGVLKRLRQSIPQEKWCPIIVVSARGDMDAFSEEFYASTDYFIQKPCLMEDILDAIEFVLKSNLSVQ